MKTLIYAKILLLCVVTMTLASCGDDIYYTMQNSDEKLCNQIWVEDSNAGETLVSKYQLRFFKENNRGQEVKTTYSGGDKVIIDREFTWRWENDSKEAIKMTFTDGVVKYFENVWVRDNYLSGKLDGKIITLTNIQ